MEKGFYTALGTPLDENGNLLADSMIRQIEQQIEAGASGLLVMGSMGIEAYIRNDQYAKVAEVSAAAAKGRVPVLVGVTDVSIARVMDRVQAISHVDGIDGFVSTVPYYATVNQAEIFNFYNEIANRTKRPIYLYDLPGVTKAATSPDTVKKLWKNPFIKGIKSGNMVTQRVLHRAEDRPADFSMMYSNLDDFDIAYKWGIDKNLDGMFSCTPKTAQKLYRALAAEDYETAAKALDDIIALRNLLLNTNHLLASYSHAMTLLGCKGFYAQDYAKPASGEEQEMVAAAMKALGEI